MPLRAERASPTDETSALAARDRLRTSVAGSMVGKAVELVTLGLLAVVVPRVLGPHDYGRFAVPLTIVTLVSLAMTLGGPAVMVRFVPAAPVGERVALARGLGARLARGRALQLVALVLVALGASLAAPDTFPPTTVGIVAASIALSVGATLALQVPLGLGRTGPWAARYPLQNAALIGAVLVLHPIAGELGPIVAILVSSLVAAAFGAAVVRPVLEPRVPAVALPPGAVRFGVLQAGGAALVQVVHRGGVVLVAAFDHGTAEVGFAALATGIAIGVSYAVLQAFTVSLPHLPVPGTSASTGAEAVLRRLAGGLLAAILPAGVLGAVLLPRLVGALFGEGYEGAVDAFVPAIGVVVLAPLAALLVQVTSLRLRPEVALASGGAAVLAFLATGWLAVPAWGAAGATTASLAGIAVGIAVSARMLRGAGGPKLTAVSLAGTAAVILLGAAAA